MKIGIVNDLRMAREILRRIIAAAPEHEVLWTANDGQEALDHCLREPPDLILMDLIMPVVDGVEATRQIMAASPCLILIVTASVGGNASMVYEAMSHGAVDATNTPALGFSHSDKAAQTLLAKIADVGKLTAKPAPAKKAPPKRPSARVAKGKLPGIVAIGASTGGPRTLAAILSQLAPDFPAAIAVIQHIDRDFTDGLAKWLNTQTPLDVTIAQEGDRPVLGNIYLAGRNDHLIINPNGRFRYTPHPIDTAYRPSIDTFYESLLSIRPQKLTAVLLTGMGPDGANGMLSLRRAGYHTIAQDKDSSVIYGMPRAAAEMDAAVEILPLHQIPKTLNKIWEKRQIDSQTK